MKILLKPQIQFSSHTERKRDLEFFFLFGWYPTGNLQSTPTLSFIQSWTPSKLNTFFVQTTKQQQDREKYTKERAVNS